jgi:hypothetical protein
MVTSNQMSYRLRLKETNHIHDDILFLYRISKRLLSTILFKSLRNRATIGRWATNFDSRSTLNSSRLSEEYREITR